MSYLNYNHVLNAAVRAKGCPKWILAPAPEHEAIISFFSSYLVGGWIKDRYQDFVKSVFDKKDDEVKAILTPNFGQALSRKLIDLVKYDDRKSLLALLPSLRRQLLFRSLAKTPFFTIGKIFEHHITEARIRYAQKEVSSICILGPDGAGKSSVIGHLQKELTGATKEIYFLHLKPQIFKRKTSHGPATDPQGQRQRSAILSVLKIWVWALELWVDQIAHGYRHITLRIWDRYYHDLLVDPRRYRYGGPVWLARWVGKIIPKPDLWILLDAPAEVLQKRKQEVPPEESKRQRQAYLELIKGFKNAVVIDASQPRDKVVVDVREAIVDFMETRTRGRLGKQ
ncbi:MAG: hypothetical protein IH995_08595 [Proteobacteria bacterium]|nr:hypothetical protein [Pseudomonadota bacterium]